MLRPSWSRLSRRRAARRRLCRPARLPRRCALVLPVAGGGARAGSCPAEARVGPCAVRAPKRTRALPRERAALLLRLLRRLVAARPGTLCARSGRHGLSALCEAGSARLLLRRRRAARRQCKAALLATRRAIAVDPSTLRLRDTWGIEDSDDAGALQMTLPRDAWLQLPPSRPL